MPGSPSQGSAAGRVPPPPEAAHRRGLDRGFLIAGIILVALTLRAPYTGVGPLLTAIRGELGLSAAAAGLLTAVPLFAFGLVSPVAPQIARRLGMEATLLAVLVLLAAGIALRWLPSVAALFAGTILLGAAIAVGNVMMPSLVKREFPRSVGLVTSVYVTVMSLVGALAAGIAVPIAEVAPGGWRAALTVWLVPTLVAAAVWSPQLRRATPPAEPVAAAARGRLLRSPLAWKVTAFMGLQSLGFYVLMAWLPTILQGRGMSAGGGGWLLFLLQALSALSGLAVPLLTRRGIDPRRLAALVSVECLAGYVGLTLAPQFALLWVLIIAPGSGGAFVLALSFIALRAGGVREAAALSGMAQGIGYFLAACGPVAFGLIHDLFGSWTPSLVALIAVTVLQALAGHAAGVNAEITPAG